MEKIIIWFNPRKKEYYYRVVKYSYTDYYVGYRNAYDHEIVLIIHDLYFQYKIPFSRRLKNKIIRYLEK